MATYLELQADINRLQKEAEAAREQEKAAVVEEIQQLIIQFRIYPEELGLRPTLPKSGAATGKPPRFRDPVSGATWSGFGRAPNWMAGKKREDFAI